MIRIVLSFITLSWAFSGFCQPTLPSPKVQVEVKVLGADGVLVEDVMVILLRAASDSCPYDTIATSTQINADSSFLFTEVDTGNYLLNARVVDQEYVTYFTPHYQPTYYPDADIWHSAQPIKMNSDTALQIEMNYTWIPQDAFAWGSEIKGKLLSNSSPVSGSTILIKRFVGYKHSSASADSLFEVYHFTTTDDDGDYHFFGIEEGLYQLDVDLPGIAMKSMPAVEIDGDLQDRILEVNFRADECLINLEVTYPMINNISIPAMTISPNPANDFIKIEGLQPGSPILLTDLTGHTLIKTRERSIKISQLPNGIYLIRVPAAGFTETIIVQH